MLLHTTTPLRALLRPCTPPIPVGGPTATGGGACGERALESGVLHARLTRDGRLALEADLPPATMGHSKNYLDFVLRVVNRTAPASEPEWTGIIGW